MHDDEQHRVILRIRTLRHRAGASLPDALELGRPHAAGRDAADAVGAAARQGARRDAPRQDYERGAQGGLDARRAGGASRRCEQAVRAGGF